MDCPKCGDSCHRDEADIGVGVIYGPWGCCCGWSEDPRYDCSDGPSPAQIEAGNGRYVDQWGGSMAVDALVAKLGRFGLPEDHVRDVFSVEKSAKEGD